MTLMQACQLPRQRAGGLRVLHVRTVRGNGGGPEKTLFNSPDYLRRLGVHAEALYLLDAHSSSDALLARAERCDMPVHVVREKSALDVHGATAFARLVRTGGFHIVHTHDYKSNTLARMLTAAGDYRVVATAHGYNKTTRREGCYYALEKMLLRRADAVICPSRPLADLLAESGVSRRRLHVIYNAIEPQHWALRPYRAMAAQPRVLYVGRLSREKNVQALFQATAMLTRRGDARFRLRIVGEGPERQRLGELAEQLGLAEHVTFTGRVDNVAAELAAADIFVNPSSTEAMPNSVLEALAVGAPVIATDVGDTAELVLDGQTGTLIPPGDIAALAAAVAWVADHGEAASLMALRGRDHIERRFDFSMRMAHIVALYRGVLAAGALHA